jgi:hypothetical protein
MARKGAKDTKGLRAHTFSHPAINDGMLRAADQAMYEAKGLGVDGKYVVVFAGSLAKDPAQGILIVCAQVDHGCRFFMTPQKSGSARITGFSHSRLMIQQANAKEAIYFYVPALAFAATMDGIASTSAPVVTQRSMTQTPGTPYPKP